MTGKRITGIFAPSITGDALSLGNPVAIATASAIAQVANITATTLFTPVNTGMFRISVYLVDSTADVTAGAATAVIGYTDPVHAQTFSSSSVLLTTLGTFTQSDFSIFSTSGVSVTYFSTHFG